MTDEPRNYCEMMDFPNTFDEFANQYGFKDKNEVYTNGSELIPVFRVKQWLEHINKTTTMIDKSNFSQDQYKADLQSAYDCGVASAKQESTTKNDSEVITKRKELAKLIREEFARLGMWAYKVDALNIQLSFEMLDIILEALDQNPTTSNDLAADCISRKQAVETIQKYGVGCFDADEFSPEECERFIISELNKLPSVSNTAAKKRALD